MVRDNSREGYISYNIEASQNSVTVASKDGKDSLRRIFSGVRGRILLFMLIVSTLTGVLAGLSAYYIARSSIRDQVYSNLSNVAGGVSGIIRDAWVPTLEGQMQLLAGTAEKLYGMYEGTGGISKGLEETEGRIPGFKRLSVFLPNGYLLASSDPAYRPGHMEELEGLEPGETVVIPFRVMGELPGQEKVMTIAAPIVIGDEVAGVLAGDVPPERISESMGSLTVGSSGEVYLVNGEGQLVTLPPKAGEDSGLEILGEPMDTEGVRRVRNGERGVAEYENYAGEKVLGSYLQIPELGWGLVVEEDADQAFSQLGSLRIGIILIVLGLAMAAMIASLFFSRRISEPLVTLKTGAEQLGLGDLGYRIDLRGAEELQSLARSFNRMAGAVQSSHEMMEEKVRESTRDLRVLNEMITSMRRNIRPDEALQRALQLFMEYTAYDIGWCYLAGADGWRLLFRRCPPAEAPQLPEFITPGEGQLGRIMESGEAVFWGSVLEADAGEALLIVPEGSFAAIPLRSASRALGLICLASTQKRHLPGVTKATLRAMADEAGIALENALLYLELRGHIAELEKANLELRSLDEMKSNFISAVTHELKQPLALIGGYAQTAYDYYDSLTYAEEMHCLRVIVERTQFLTSMVEDLLDISMLELGRIRLRGEEIELPALVRKAAEQHVSGGSEQTVSVDFPVDFPVVVADARRIEQVLSNLFSNAVKFSGGRGEIRVSGTVRGEHVRIRFEDSGVGIDPSQLDKIFGRFYQADATTRRPYPGVGLGLFICRQIIAAHNGRIWAENRPEGGSAFVFELPLDPGLGGEFT
jgi:signal transduction histidine kinase